MISRHLFRSALTATVLLAGCAMPALKMFTLGAPAIATGARPMQPGAPVIAIDRLALPDYLDTQDILTRDGDSLRRSSTGRFASRLSLAATDLLTARLAQRYPDALVTDQPQLTTPTYRLIVNINRLDVGVEGKASLEADWSIISMGGQAPVQRDRMQVTLKGPVANDADVVALEHALLVRLADQITIPAHVP